MDKNLFLITKKLTLKMMYSVKILTENNIEKDKLISYIRSKHLQYYMIPITKINTNILALYLKEVKSIF